MEHSEFVDKFRSKQITVRVDKNKAGHFYGPQGLMPQDLRSTQAFLRTVMFGLVIGGVALFFYVSWWIAVGVVFLGLIFSRVCQRQAAEGLLETALHSQTVFQVVMENDVFIINPSI